MDGVVAQAWRAWGWRWLRRLVRGLGVVIGGVALVAAYARWVEPQWIAVRHVRLSAAPRVTLVHISDLHHKGDVRKLERIVARINAIRADAVCFTGDLVEERSALPEALAAIRKVRMPVFGIPGNHDLWAHLPADEVRAAFAATGGQWMDEAAPVVVRERLELVTLCRGAIPVAGSAGALTNTCVRRRVLMIHAPVELPGAGGVRWDAILAGHSHGGQVRLPWIGPVLAAFRSGEFERGLYVTPVGPLYVSPGLGTFYWDVRLGCRPEITVIDL